MRPKTIALLVVALAIVISVVGLQMQPSPAVPTLRSDIQTNQPSPKESLTPYRDQSMQITSPAFEHNGAIPPVYTCDGKGMQPPLMFSGVPPGAKSLVLVMDDPDTPSGAVFDHWIVWNIPPQSVGIGEGESPIGVVGRNTAGTVKYFNPCPPDREHRYFFKLYALDTLLDLPAGSSKADVESAMQGHVIVQAELIGRYNRQR